MKRLLLFTMILTIIISINVPIFASSDEPSSWAKEEVESAIKNEYVPTQLQSNYQKPITREEFAELFVNAVFKDFNRYIQSYAGMTEEAAWGTTTLTIDMFLKAISTTEKFTDTDNKYVKVANILGMVNGIGDNKFDPEGLITREQAAVMFVNYFQTVDPNNTNEAPNYLDDLDSVSPWAKEAVARAYGARYLQGNVKAIEDEWGNVIKKGHFDSKAIFTREQAIIVISRLGINGKKILNKLVLRGYVEIGMDALFSGFNIEGNTIKMKSTGFDYKYCQLKEYWRTQSNLIDYVNKYTTEQLIALLLKPNLARGHMTTDENLKKVLSGKQTFYDYKLFTIKHNIDNYLVVITKMDGYGYMCGGGSRLLYGDDNQYTVSVQN
ncbi:S-layer homology domain-containing protein [Vallitalea guaymasensis]|uniref:S-layer homology domain-containing protein n=1 Tax=Vallitalea guaymasensis TaxID=1185412 RepID=UPI0023551C12|nr:S-layer homology domain-containing protein [Vallitalea guaymasensis]